MLGYWDLGMMTREQSQSMRNVQICFVSSHVNSEFFSQWWFLDVLLPFWPTKLASILSVCACFDPSTFYHDLNCSMKDQRLVNKSCAKQLINSYINIQILSYCVHKTISVLEKIDTWNDITLVQSTHEWIPGLGLNP